ncbi:MAG: polysaccharide biosynthesis/export family protein [Marinilabiliaceae bacterium]|nr:polysaccharide biosynthesis/export family protein [Marinilabiliaceae bacterium]
MTDTKQRDFIHPLKNYALFIFILLGAVSCIPQRETVLLQDNEESALNRMQNITDRYFLQPNDYLFINVSTPDPKISEFFNQTSTSSGGGQQNQNFSHYLIDDTMNIDFPYVGKINMAGCNVKIAKSKLQEALKPFLKEYTLTFKLASNKFTTLGEFRSQGVHDMGKEQITIFEAVAMAGGVSVYGKRKEMKLLRQLPTGPVTYTIDLTDKNIVNSEYYYIYPNDMLYVRPMKAKNWGIGESFSIGMISAALALYLTISSLTK